MSQAKNKAKKEKKKLLYTLEEFIEMDFPDPKKRASFLREVKREETKLEKEYLQEVGSKLKRRRESKGINQEELARILRTKAPAISRIENGRQNITLGYLAKLCKAMGLEYEITLRPDQTHNKQSSSNQQSS